MSRARRRLLGAVAAVVLAGLLTACADSPELSVTPPAIEVDSPALRAQKKAAGIETCVPGQGSNEISAVTLPCLGGGPDVDLSTLQGPMVVNLWASWCGPCETEMPILADFYRKYGDRVPVLGVDYSDPQADQALELAAASKVDYPLVADTTEALRGQSPVPVQLGLPAWIFIREDGSVSFQPKPIEKLDDLVEMVEAQLAVTL